jgi:hypothetical protein
MIGFDIPHEFRSENKGKKCFLHRHILWLVVSWVMFPPGEYNRRHHRIRVYVHEISYSEFDLNVHDRGT